jgi:phage shock protein PspC (stress-responsive transcriptional regulator)
VKVLGGVSGGLAQYFNIDPIIVRILFVVFTLMHGMGLVLYIILWIVVPEEPFELAYPIKNDETKTEDQSTENASVNFDGVPPEVKKNGSGRVIAGTILIALGVLFFADRFIPTFDFRDIVPIAFVLLGGLLIWNSLKK